ncbi:hypothetical protein L1049_007903 [Liquidambar formosana]|uniref:Carbonic anhydrase n=1 Tax=Liquidambar formosana TaxID=63359 RepID=A0AAP0S9X4_LIQFO
MQSPIDLSNQRVKVIPKLGELKRSYKPCNATVNNRGHDIAENVHPCVGYDLELHMVHLSGDLNVKYKIAVVGLFYKIGQPDAFLSKLTRNIMSMTDRKGERKMGVIDPTEIKLGGKKYYKYMGSLTVPPCTEGVIWTINKKVRTVSRVQVKLLREAVHDYAEKNARPVQALHSREIHFYDPLSHLEDTKDEREFDYFKRSEKGPQQWGELKKEWAACKNGVMQSPIDLLHRRVTVIPKLGELWKSYKPCNASLKNRGHDIEIKWYGEAGSIQINGTYYFLNQCHWHSPSEHSINGKRYALELHMVHVTRDLNVKNNISVIGLLYDIGAPDPFLSKLTRSITSMSSNSNEERNLGVIDPTEIKMGGHKYYRYMGSLTTPPCTEGVIWTLNKKVRTVSREQVKLLREAVHDYAENNARPTQSLNGREIDFYKPGFHTRGNA